MPARLQSPVLTVDAGLIAKVDPRNAENLFGMWTVFSKCAESLEEGRRFENLSWRLWNRQTFCCPQTTDRQAISRSPSVARSSTSSRKTPDDMPELSVSVDSVRSEVSATASSRDSDSLDLYRPVIVRSDSTESRSRGSQKHFTSFDLEKMVINIQEKKELEPLEPRLANSIPQLPSKAVQPSTSVNVQSASSEDLTATSTESSFAAQAPLKSALGKKAISMAQLQSEARARSSMNSLSVVRGFSPNHVSSSYRSSPRLSTPSQTIPESVRKAPKGKGGATFLLGGSSGEEESSFDSHMSYKQQGHVPQKSSLSDGLKKAVPKQTSFNEQVTRAFYTRPDETEDDVSESAIEDDDSSDWDSVSDSARSSFEEKVTFERVDSRPNLVSRPSLLSKFLKEGEPHLNLNNAGSRSTPIMRSRKSTPQGPSLATSPAEEGALTMKAMAMGAPRANPLGMNPPSTAQPIPSPRTTRRHMLTTELTESLRRNLLLERQQKNTNAAFKRRHTSQDVANLQEYPGPKPFLDKNYQLKNNASSIYFEHGLQEYHSKGW